MILDLLFLKMKKINNAPHDIHIQNLAFFVAIIHVLNYFYGHELTVA